MLTLLLNLKNTWIRKTLGLGKYFTMNDLLGELNKPVINKFPRKKIIVNYINEIHSCDLVNMVKYSRLNNKKFLKKENLNLYGVIKKAHFSVKKC